MKHLTLTTAADRLKRERASISETVRRALARRRQSPATKPMCRDALHTA